MMTAMDRSFCSCDTHHYSFFLYESASVSSIPFLLLLTCWIHAWDNFASKQHELRWEGKTRQGSIHLIIPFHAPLNSSPSFPKACLCSASVGKEGPEVAGGIRTLLHCPCVPRKKQLILITQKLTCMRTSLSKFLNLNILVLFFVEDKFDPAITVILLKSTQVKGCCRCSNDIPPMLKLNRT